MITRTLSLAAMAFSLVSSLPLAAQQIDPVRITRVADRPTITLDPTKAYLLVESPMRGSQGNLLVVQGSQTNFLLEPTAAERADWAAQRAEGLARAIDRYPGVRARYEREMEVHAQIRTRASRLPAEPVEPTEESFSWPDIESRKQITIGPMNRFFAADGLSLWLYEVPAGTYTYYSNGMAGMADCACLGSVSFAVTAGQVTALRVGHQSLDAQGNPINRAPEGLNSNDVVIRSAMVVAAPSPSAFDPRIPREMIVPAEFTPVNRLPNWFGNTVNRIMPIPGVLDYDRGRVVDLRPAIAELEPMPMIEAALQP